MRQKLCRRLEELEKISAAAAAQRERIKPRDHDPFTREGIEQCRREIAAIEEQLRARHPEVYGLCLALADWSAELRILEGEQRQEKPPGLNPAPGEWDLRSIQPLME